MSDNSKSSWHGGKGDDSRISNFRKYQESPLWDNLKAKREKADKDSQKSDKDEVEDPD